MVPLYKILYLFTDDPLIIYDCYVQAFHLIWESLKCVIPCYLIYRQNGRFDLLLGMKRGVLGNERARENKTSAISISCVRTICVHSVCSGLTLPKQYPPISNSLFANSRTLDIRKVFCFISRQPRELLIFGQSSSFFNFLATPFKIIYN